MDRSRHEPQPPSAAGDERRVADHLDRLSAEDAEAVIRRAIELTDADARRDDYGTLDRQTLEIVARELGIDLAHLNQAMAERHAAASTDGDDTWLDRLMGVDRLDGATIVKGNIDAVYRALVTWLTSHEGLRAVRSAANRGEWEKDANTITSLKMGLGLTNSTRTLRNAGTVTHAITSLGPDEHVLTIEAGKSHVRRTGLTLLAVAAALAIGGGVALATGPGDLFDGLAVALATAVALGAGAIAIVRTWSSSIATGIRRALHAVTDPAGAGVFDRLPGSLGRFIRSLGRRR